MARIKKAKSNYEYFVSKNTSGYRGEWVAISDSKIVAHGRSAQAVYKRAKKLKLSQAISLAKVPKEQLMILKISE